jgi:hypothetical protein
MSEGRGFVWTDVLFGIFQTFSYNIRKSEDFKIMLVSNTCFIKVAIKIINLTVVGEFSPRPKISWGRWMPIPGSK